MVDPGPPLSDEEQDIKDAVDLAIQEIAKIGHGFGRGTRSLCIYYHQIGLRCFQKATDYDTN